MSDQEKQRLLLGRLTLALFAVGFLWRSLRYLLRFPIWGDEAMICLNFLELDYVGLMHQLRNCQVAPLLFLWGELASLRWFGCSELAMRLLPFLAGVGSLLLFWRWASRTLPPLARMLAVGFLAVAIWPVSMGTFTKPYSLDLFMALALLLPATCWLYQPQRIRWLLLLTLITPLAVFSSYPVVFVGGAISLALIPAVWRQRGWKPRVLHLAYSIALAGSFLGHYWITGKGQLQTPANHTTTEHGMQAYWADGFPPSAPLLLAKWLVFAHTGQIMAYPMGAERGGSSLTTLLCLIGAWNLWTSRRRALLVMCTAPFALGLIAALLHRYPYGASCRLAQYLAPAVCLMAGMGAAVLIERLRSPALRQRWAIGVCTALILVGIGGMIRDAIKPYRDRETQWTRQVMQQFAVEAQSGAPIVVLNSPEEVDALFRWYIEQYGDRVSWNGTIDWERVAASGQVLCVRYWCHGLTAPEELPRSPAHGPAIVPAWVAVQLMQQGEQPWVLAKAVTDAGVPASWRDPVPHLDQFHWVRQDNGHACMVP